MWNLIKITQKNLFTKQKQTQTFQNQTYGYQRGNIAERGGLEGWDCDWRIHTTIQFFIQQN